MLVNYDVMRVLVNGLIPHDSGKTTMAISLIKALKEMGFDVGFSKPISGINGWYQYHCIEESIKLGFLVGEDLLKLHEACQSDNSLIIEGAVVSVVFPPDPERIGWRTDIYSFHVPTMMRIVEKHYIFMDQLSILPSTLKTVIDKLIKILKPKKAYNFEKLFEMSVYLADNCLKMIDHDFIVIESYSNVSSPTLESMNVDYVLSVAPGKVALVNGNDFRRALEVIPSQPWNVTTESVLEILKPMKTFEIPPKKTDEVAYDVLSFLKCD